MGRELDLLASNHSQWIMMVQGLGCNPAYSEDIVQEAYMRIHSYLEKGLNIDYGDNDVNTFYFYMTLKAVYVSHCRKKSVSSNSVEFCEALVMDNIDNDSFDDNLSESDKELDNLLNGIFKEVNSWDFYHKNMFIAYFTTDNSLRSISKKTKLGTASVYNSTTKYKKIIRSKFREEYNNYINNK